MAKRKTGRHSELPKGIAFEALFHAQMTTVSAAAKKFGVTRYTINNWRKGVASDDDLNHEYSEFYNRRVQAVDEDARKLILALMGRIRESIDETDVSTPNGLEAVVKAIDITSDMLLIRRAVNASVPIDIEDIIQENRLHSETWDFPVEYSQDEA